MIEGSIASKSPFGALHSGKRRDRSSIVSRDIVLMLFENLSEPLTVSLRQGSDLVRPLCGSVDPRSDPLDIAISIRRSAGRTRSYRRSVQRNDAQRWAVLRRHELVTGQGVATFDECTPIDQIQQCDQLGRFHRFPVADAAARRQLVRPVSFVEVRIFMVVAHG